MNALHELLAAEESPSIEDLRAATTTALHAVRHDRRVDVLSFTEVRELAGRMFHTPDIRTLVLETMHYT